MDIMTSDEEREGAEYNLELFKDYVHELRQLASDATLELGLLNDDLVLACIEVDSDWVDIIKMFKPEYEEPDAEVDFEKAELLCFTSEGCQELAHCCPDFAEVINTEIRSGMLKVLVFSELYCSVFELEPKKIVLH